MSKPENNAASQAISAALRAKQERRAGGSASVADDIAALEASLLADIEAFDLDAAERRARREENAGSGAGLVDPRLAFPEIVPTASVARPQPKADARPAAPPPVQLDGSNLLNQLRQQAEIRQRELHSQMAERTSLNEAIDQALKQTFFYLHEFVQQLNIVKPGIPRAYPLIENYAIDQLAWQEGFADYRTQSQSSGALVELVSFSCQLAAPGNLRLERDGPAVDRFRKLLFDYGLPFDCKEFKNERRYVERAEFAIRAQLSVSTRWRADFDNACIVIEARNLERLGSSIHTLHPRAIDRDLLDEFGRLILAQPNRFRELARR